MAWPCQCAAKKSRKCSKRQSREEMLLESVGSVKRKEAWDITGGKVTLRHCTICQ